MLGLKQVVDASIKYISVVGNKGSRHCGFFPPHLAGLASIQPPVKENSSSPCGVSSFLAKCGESLASTRGTSHHLFTIERFYKSPGKKSFLTQSA